MDQNNINDEPFGEVIDPKDHPGLQEFEEEWKDVDHWTYMVVRKSHDDPVYQGKKLYTYGIHEVFCKKDGTPVNLTEESVKPFAESESDPDPINSLRQELKWMFEATKKPVLDYDKFMELKDKENKDDNKETD